MVSSLLDIGGQVATHTSFAFSADGKAATGHQRDKLQAPNLEPHPMGRLLWSYVSFTANPLKVAYAPTTQTIAIANDRETIDLWHIGDEQPFSTIRPSHDRVVSLAFSADGDIIGRGRRGWKNLPLEYHRWTTTADLSPAKCPGRPARLSGRMATLFAANSAMGTITIWLVS